jgi:predicted GNAT family N-acyltransferase
MSSHIIHFENKQLEFKELSRDIRYKVFVVEQNVPESIEYDEYEDECRHYLLFADNIAVATCRWRTTEKGVKLERFAVLKDYRGKGLGSKLVQHILDEVKSIGKPIYLHAQEVVIPFYEKLGFKIYGDVFIEADIRHFLMNYENPD